MKASACPWIGSQSCLPKKDAQVQLHRPKRMFVNEVVKTRTESHWKLFHSSIYQDLKESKNCCCATCDEGRIKTKLVVAVRENVVCCNFGYKIKWKNLKSRMLINFSHPKMKKKASHKNTSRWRGKENSFFVRRRSFAVWSQQKGSKLTLIHGRILCWCEIGHVLLLVPSWHGRAIASLASDRQTQQSIEARNITEARDVEIGSIVSSYSTAVPRRSTWGETWSFSWRIWATSVWCGKL